MNRNTYARIGRTSYTEILRSLWEYYRVEPTCAQVAAVLTLCPELRIAIRDEYSTVEREWLLNLLSRFYMGRRAPLYGDKWSDARAKKFYAALNRKLEAAYELMQPRRPLAMDIGAQKRHTRPRTAMS